ncbi:MAG: ABC transporter permease [Methanomassiliicoccales archaeon]
MNLQILARATWVTAQKDIRIYYRKAPVFIFGLILPTFLFFAFFVGRELDIKRYFPGFLAMALFFTSSSVGPLIVPWEKQAGTFERLLTYPVSIGTIILGDIIAGALFGITISTIVGVVGIVFLNLEVESVVMLFLAYVLGNLCFSGLGVTLSSPAGRYPANIMMLAALVRFPLIFISGVFVPLSEMSAPGVYISYLSPLTYLVDALNHSLGQPSAFPWPVDLLVLSFFFMLFILSARFILTRKSLKGL